MPKLRHGSIFSGIGGFDLAAHWMGWENVFNCDNNPFSQKILQYYWPNAITYNDIRETDFFIHNGNIDILTGGFPCQPFSEAGGRQGTEDDRYLWPEMFRVVREVRPRYIVAENVYGLVNWNKGMVLRKVCNDLESEGYEVCRMVLPASGVGAPHIRQRLWLIARHERIGLCQTDGDNDNTDTNPKMLEERDRKGTAGGGNIPQDRVESSYRSRGWERFPTESPICGRTDGLPNRLDGIAISRWRKESLIGLGNAIVPQVALRIFETIQEECDEKERMDSRCSLGGLHL